MRNWPAVAATALLAVQTAAPAQPPVPLMDEVVVTGEREGPGMWHVRHGAAELWILGSISPLPKGITWRAKQVEHVLGTTTLVLVQKPIEIGIPRILWLLITDRGLVMLRGSSRLHDVLPADLYARFAAQRAKYTTDAGKWEHYRPIVAAALLQRDAFHSVGLSMRLDLGASVRELAKKHGVRVDEVSIAGVGDLVAALKSLPPVAESKCVEASLATIETGLPRLVDRSKAWADGNVERIENTPEPPEVDACRASLDAGASAADLIERASRTWFQTLNSRLQTGGVTLAVVNMDLLLEQGGLLEQLRAKGYEVEGP